MGEIWFLWIDNLSNRLKYNVRVSAGAAAKARPIGTRKNRFGLTAEPTHRTHSIDKRFQSASNKSQSRAYLFLLYSFLFRYVTTARHRRHHHHHYHRRQRVKCAHKQFLTHISHYNLFLSCLSFIFSFSSSNFSPFPLTISTIAY